ncbi:MAG: glycogen/starch synthase [Candidatus Marinimicrobia bacterium]|nr:glycogen/starch synthase [Candidatus Neomarinimicrobiota bacterium]
MMALKVYYLSSEIAPFSSTYSIAQFSKRICSLFQDRDFDIRLIQPKYGYISERKFILREVIRLREMPITFAGEDRIGSVKSAFIPNTKVQVYFLEDVEYFKPVSNLLYKARNGRMLKDNPERYAYFARVALENLKHLFWKPDVIVCNDWQMSFVPALYQMQYAADEFYKDIKTVFLLHSANANALFNRASYDALDLFATPDDRLPEPAEEINNLDLAFKFSDQVVAVRDPEGVLDKELESEPEIARLLKAHNGVKWLEVPSESDEAWEQAADQFEQILRNI